jgi:hypothetical protein
MRIAAHALSLRYQRSGLMTQTRTDFGSAGGEGIGARPPAEFEQLYDEAAAGPTLGVGLK